MPTLHNQGIPDDATQQISRMHSKSKIGSQRNQWIFSNYIYITIAFLCSNIDKAHKYGSDWKLPTVVHLIDLKYRVLNALLAVSTIYSVNMLKL